MHSTCKQLRGTDKSLATASHRRGFQKHQAYFFCIAFSKGVNHVKAPSANGRGKPRPAQRHPGIGDELLLRTGAFHNYSDPELHIIAGDFFIFPLTISVRTSNKQSSEKFETSQVEHPSYSDEMAVTYKDPCLYFHDIV